jgi:short-subunit dehydrogenase
MNERIVVITGGSAGIGRASACAFARDGAHLALIARGQERLESARREIEQLGRRCLIIPADVADAAAIESAAERIEIEMGSINVWVNNAMASVFSPVKETSPEEFKRVTEVTYLGYVHGTLAALKRMLPRDHGVIVQVGSALAYRGIPLQAAYCAAKHAVEGFCDSLRTELRHDHSRVQITMVQMPAVNTPQFGWVKSRLPRKAQPVPPIYQPEIAADAILYASKHPKREYILGWPALKAIWGNKAAPWLADRVLARQGYESQQYDGAENPERPNNLWQPVAGDHGARGNFDARATNWSLQWWLSKHRYPLLATGLTALCCTLVGKRGRTRMEARSK